MESHGFSSLVILLLAAGAFSLFLYFAWTALQQPSTEEQPPSYDTLERQAMPDELAQGRLVFSEEEFWCNAPVPLSARVDQVFLTPSRMLVPVENKNRKRASVTESDVIELSVQAVVLAHDPRLRAKGCTVASYGYVRCLVGGRPTMLRTPLLNAKQVAYLYARYHGLRQGKIAAQPAPQPWKCGKCSQRLRCPTGRALPAAP